MATLALALSSLMTAGCAISGEDSAHRIPGVSVPGGLLPDAPTSVAGGTGPTANVTLYFENDDGLVAVDRAVRPPVTLERVLGILALGPSAAERGAGLQSPLSTAQPLRTRSVRDGTATVDVRGDLADLGGQDQILAAAQLVYTVTAFPDVSAVRLLVDGQPASVPTADGSLDQSLLRRSDYVALAPR